MPRAFTGRDDGGVLDRMSEFFSSEGPATGADDCNVTMKTTKSQNSNLFQDFVRQSEKTMLGMVF